MPLSLSQLDNMLSSFDNARRRQADLQRMKPVSMPEFIRSTSREALEAALADERLDAARFRWWFAQPHMQAQYPTLKAWRERIDGQMLKEAKP